MCRYDVTLFDHWKTTFQRKVWTVLLRRLSRHSTKVLCSSWGSRIILTQSVLSAQSWIFMLVNDKHYYKIQNSSTYDVNELENYKNRN